MPIKNNQIETAPKKLPAVASEPDVLGGEGVFYVDVVSGRTEGFFKDDEGNVTQITTAGAILAPVQSVNGLSGTVVLDASYISEVPNRNWLSDAERSKISSVTTGAEPNPNQASSPELTNGTEVNLRSFSPANIKSMIDTHSGGGGGGAVDSVNGETGAVVLTTDDISDTAQTNKWFTDSERTKLSGVATGAEVNPDVVSQAEAEAGTATTERTWTAERVAQAIAALASGGGTQQTYRITLPAGASLSARIGAATTPAGWTLDSADNDAEAQFGSDTESLVIIWDAGLGTKLADIQVLEDNSATNATGGVKSVGSSDNNPSNIKTNSSQTKAVVQFSALSTQTTRDLYVVITLV